VTPADFERALASGNVVELLEAIEVARGDCVYLPSGICHALGAGIVVAEIQTPSDTTFRVWDWNRDDPGRRLHLDEARACLQFGAAQEDGTRGVTRTGDATAFEANGLRSRRLLRTRFFSLEWIEATRGAAFPIEPTGVAEVWMHLAGSAEWRTASTAMPVRAGTTVLRPAAVEPGEVLLHEGHALLRVRCGSPLEGALA
jgi:mannose-6-phosphate isomerase